ncbi:MAG: hypothetical protein AAF570_19505, partial [Bacteroidota bacterium]
ENDMEKSQKMVIEYIEQHPNLSQYFQNRADARNGEGAVDTIGANGSFGSAGLIDQEHRFTLEVHDDPSISIPNKWKYMREGQDLEGVLLAALECWALDQPKALQTMSERDRDGRDDWQNYMIETIFALMVHKYPENGEILRQFADKSYYFVKMMYYEDFKVSELNGIDTMPEALALFDALSLSTSYEGAETKLVIDQAYMTVQQSATGSAGMQFLEFLGAFSTAADASEHVDLSYLKAKGWFVPLLNSPFNLKGRICLAMLAVHQDQITPEVRKVLGSQLNAKNEWQDPEQIKEILGGLLGEAEVRIKLGVMDAPLPDGNVKPRGANQNTEYVTPCTEDFFNTKENLQVFEKPDSSSKVAGTLPHIKLIHVIGKTEDFLAVEFKYEEGWGTAFVKKEVVE